ncbi:MAG: hypothetical protein OXQ29_12625 [Rhodospirillaceae bacterium]|nr:hypothetical protein [Rhodospirillaceae bacterium]
MADPAFDTLEAARRLEAADIPAEQADAIVDVVNQSASQTVTVERFETGVAGLHARVDSVYSELNARIDSVHSELSARIDSVQSELSARIESVRTELLTRIDSLRSELRADFFRSLLIAVGIFLAANTLLATIFGILLTNGAFGTVTFGTP